MAREAMASEELSDEVTKAIREGLGAWYRAHRRELPWRASADPYAVWISEVMLQQTQVRTVIPYFARWMARFPTVQALAEAPLEEVLHCWAGLGYYARARNLHAAARAVVERHGGEFPADLQALLALPGVGRYTAGAILSIAFALPAPIVDGNVIRVLSRLFLIEGDPARGAVQRRLWALAEALVPDEAPGDFNQAMMELGATICAPLSPLCAACPVAALCRAREAGRAEELPQVASGPAMVAEEHVSVVIRRNGYVLLAQRPRESRWGGLWEFPRVVRSPEESIEEAACRAAREVAALAVETGARLAVVRHTVTHHRITLHAVAARPVGAAAVGGACEWVPLAEVAERPLSAPQTRILRALDRAPGPDGQTALELSADG